MVSLSVIIPTHNRSTSLARAVRHALALDYPPDAYEIIAVDNASTDGTEQIIHELQQDSHGRTLRYLREDRLGLHHARHVGARAATGELLVFTDDDATFDRGWLQAYADAFLAHPEMLAAGGPVRPIWESPPPPWLLKYMKTNDETKFPVLSLMEPYEEFRLGREVFFFGVNMAVRRSVFTWTGFRPELFGSRTIGSGESGLLEDLRERGAMVGYVPKAVAYHHIPAHRMTVNYIRKWAWHLGACQMYERWWSRPRPLGALGREVLVVVLHHWGVWLADAFVRHRRDSRAIAIQFHASLGWCRLAYVWWMLTDPEVQAALELTDFRP